jgi:hypothetical protein
MRLRVTWYLLALLFLGVGVGLLATPYAARASVVVPDYPRCPAHTQQLATVTGRLYRDRTPHQIDHPIALSGSATLTVFGFVEEGHPDECPGGRCNQGQLNEEFSVKLNDTEFGRYLDQGPYDQWFEAGPWSTTVIPPGEHVLQLAHLMTGRHNQPGSVTYKLSVCAAPAQVPTITVPDDIVVDAASADGTRVNYRASAVDGFGTPVDVSCAPPSGALFPIGVTTVRCTASDNFGNSATAAFSVIVNAPSAAPKITVPDDIVVDATSADGTRVSYSTSAVDSFGSPVDVSCAPPSGALFPIGVTTVRCTASDRFGNSASASFTVTVRASSGPPSITVPDDIVAEAESAEGARVAYSVSAVDGFGTPLTVTCDTPSGTVFPLGVTRVTCRAADSFGASASAAFRITVRDTTPPTLSLPASFTVVALSEEGATVEYSADAVDLVDPMPLLECSPPSSRVFAVGATVVACEASDRFGNVAVGSFTVTVVLDIVGPKVVSVSLNDGAAQTATREITLRFSATDPEPGSGVAEYLVNEYIPDLALGIWTIVRSSSWQPTSGETTRSWTLTDDAGAHYVQILARDRAGNISPQPGGAVINYVPASDTLARSATRIYRYQVQAGQQVDVRVIPLSGDPDLFVYPPSYPALAAWASENRSGEEQLNFVAPESGSYQIEVYAFSATTYRIEVTIGAAALATSDTVAEAAKPRAQRNPAFPLDVWPGMPAAEDLQYRLHLPLIR